MKGNRNKQATKYGKKETMEGQESSMSLASGMHCLPLPLPARVLFSSPWTNNAESRRPRPLGQPSARSRLTLTRQRSGPRDKHTIISTISAALLLHFTPWDAIWPR